MTAIRVAFVSSHAQPGGAERYLELLTERLGREWVAGVVSLQDGDLVDRLRAAGQPVSVVAAGRRLGIVPAAWRLRSALLSLRPQVVHANGVKAALVAGLAMRGTRIPVVWVKHDFFWDGPLVSATAAMARIVVGVSAAVTEAIPGRLQGRVRVVPNGLPVVEARVAGEPDSVVLLGRLHPVKGALQLVQAVPQVLARHPAARFVVVGADDPGEPGYPDEVRAAIARLRVGQAVRMVGHVDDPLSLLAGAGVVVIPSGPNAPGLRGEGFGLVALEAMSVGTPVVGYRCGALPEVVGDCGLLVEPGDPAALAEAIVTALEDEELRGRLAECGPRRVREHFGLDRMVAAMQAVYREAAGPRRDSRDQT